MKKYRSEKRTINLILPSKSDYRTEVGEIADVISFQNEFLGRYPSPEQTKAYLAIWGDNPSVWDATYRMLVLEVGMKGGKNYWAEGDAAYLCYRISALRDPHEYFSRITKRPVPYSRDVNFDIANVSAVDEKQAKLAFFDHVKNAFINARDPKTGDNWFERYAGLDIRESFGDFKGNIITFPARQEGMGTIRFMSFNSTAKSPEGQHYIRFYGDELSRADTKLKYREADKLNDLGEKNTAASFPNGVGKVINWSYPNDTDYDLTDQLYERSLLDESIYGVKLSTWAFNPALNKEMFAHEYRGDPVKAARIRECIKPLSRDNFYQPYVGKLDEVIAHDIENKVIYKPTNIHRETKSGKKETFTSIELIKINGDKRERCFAYDASKNKDRFIIVGGYNETIDPLRLEYFIDDDITVSTTNKMPVIDIIIVLDPIEGYSIDYLKVGDIFSALLKAFPNTKSINSDHFQNEKLRQEIILKGVESETYFFSNQKQMRLYTKKRANIWINNFAICQDNNPSHEIYLGGNKISPTKLWLLEGQKLIKEENRVDHAPNFSKDVQDAVAIVTDDLAKLEVDGVTGTASSLEGLSDERYRELCEKYMDEKYLLIQADTPENLIDERLAEKLQLKPKDVAVIARFVKENYDY